MLNDAFVTLSYACMRAGEASRMFAVAILALVAVVSIDSCAIKEIATDDNASSVSNLHRIAVGSCNNQRDGDQIWRLIEHSQPNHIILLGDNIYNDLTEDDRLTRNVSAEGLRAEYARMRNQTGWRDLLHSVGGWKGVSITFDDHDFGINNADKTLSFRNESQKLFYDFTENRLPICEGFITSSRERCRPSSGVFSSSIRKVLIPSTVKMKIDRTAEASANEGDAPRNGVPTEQRELVYKTVMLDTRSNKDPKGTKDGDFLGEEQWKWLAKELLDPFVPVLETARESSANREDGKRVPIDMILLGSSIQIIPEDKYLEETWSEFPAARDRLMMLLCLSPVPNIMLMSGDVHSAEISRGHCEVYASSSLYSSSSSFSLSLLQQKQQQPDSHSPKDTEITDSADGFGNVKQGHVPKDRKEKNGGPQILIARRELMELTSSGLSHTFDKRTVKGLPGSGPIQVRSKHRLLQEINAMYQVAYPAPHRALKLLDMYHGIHFALLDLQLCPHILPSSHLNDGFTNNDNNQNINKNNNSSSSNNNNENALEDRTKNRQEEHRVAIEYALCLKLQIVDHRGNVALSRLIRLQNQLQNHTDHTQNSDTCEISAGASASASAITRTSLSTNSRCTSASIETGISLGTGAVKSVDPISLSAVLLPTTGATAIASLLLMEIDHNTTASPIHTQGQPSRFDTLLDGDLRATFVPFWGRAPLYQRLAYRAFIAMIILVLVGTPLCAVLWFVCASLYYILIAKELKRRDRILAQNELLKNR